jgi:two-component system response regulator NreC
MPKLRLLLVDDHAVLRQGLRRLLDSEPDMEVVAESADGNEVAALVALHRPDIVVLDLAMDGLDGLSTLRRLRDLGIACKVLVLTVHRDRGCLREVLEAGAMGYLVKQADADEVIDAIRRVGEGQVVVDARVSMELASLIAGAPRRHEVDAPELTDREVATLRHIAEGYSNKEIGAALGVSVKSVETFKARAMRKLGLGSRVDVVRLARERRWVPLGESPRPSSGSS